VTAAQATTAAPRRKHRTTAYWLVTAVVVGESAIGGTLDLLRAAPFYPLMIQLGYPGYLATILGVAKLIAAAILVAPRLPRLKEWAYAGIMINMIGATASNIAGHQPVSNVVPPVVFACFAMASWALRPPSRRL
jgi:hypothetical protein